MNKLNLLKSMLPKNVSVCELQDRSYQEMSPIPAFIFENSRRKRKFKEENSESSSESSKENEKNAVLRRSARTATKISYKEKISEKSSGNEDDEDNYVDKSKSSSEDSEDENFVVTSVGAKSEYEKMIEKNIAQRMEFLKSLKIDEVKADFKAVVNTVKKKRAQPVKRFYKENKTSPPVLRKSKRLAKLDVDESEDAEYQKALVQVQEAGKREYVVRKRVSNDKSRSFLSVLSVVRAIRHQPVSFSWGTVKTIPAKLPLKEALYFPELYEPFTNDINIQKSDLDPKFVSYNQDILKKMDLVESNIAKVTPDRISTIAWHPAAETLILAAGSKYGNLGIWNVASESSPYVLKVHLEGITSLKFNPWNPVQLFSSSYDGILRCGDMVENVFDEIYNNSEQASCTYFDFLSESTFLVAQRNGEVAIVDNKTRKNQKRHTCHDYSIKTVSVHPVKKSYFITAENKGLVRLWDLRKLQKEPVVEISQHKRSTNSAFFSPITGNSILTTSLDDTICTFDSTNLTEEIPLRNLMKHNNCTGRWLSVFRATWLPHSDDAFVIGSMQDPRRIQVYDTNMDVVHIFMHENLTTITSTNAFHPFRHALAGANSSGKVLVFT